MQEAIAKANALGRPAPKLVMMTHEYPTLNAALGYAAVTGRMAATAVHVDVGTQHYGCAIHTARHSGLPVLITAGAPPVSYPGSMRGARDGSHFWVQQTPDQNGIVRQYMKWDHRLEYQDNPGLIVSRALQIAQSEPRGPVYLSLPREIAFLPADGARFPTAQQLGIALSRRRPIPTASATWRSGWSRRAIRRSSCSAPAAIARPCRRWCGSPSSSARRSATRRRAAINAFPMDHPLYQSIDARPVAGRRRAGDRGRCAVDAWAAAAAARRLCRGHRHRSDQGPYRNLRVRRRSAAHRRHRDLARLAAGGGREARRAPATARALPNVQRAGPTSHARAHARERAGGAGSRRESRRSRRSGSRTRSARPWTTTASCSTRR